MRPLVQLAPDTRSVLSGKPYSIMNISPTKHRLWYRAYTRGRTSCTNTVIFHLAVYMYLRLKMESEC